MNENNQEQNGLFEMLEESLPAFDSQGSSKNHENFSRCDDEEQKFEFLVQDMFLDHFFP
jgi:hypothetical protein